MSAGIDELALASRNAVPLHEVAGHERVETECHKACGGELECVRMRKRL